MRTRIEHIDAMVLEIDRRMEALKQRRRDLRGERRDLVALAKLPKGKRRAFKEAMKAHWTKERRRQGELEARDTVDAKIARKAMLASIGTWQDHLRSLRHRAVDECARHDWPVSEIRWQRNYWYGGIGYVRVEPYVPPQPSPEELAEIKRKKNQRRLMELRHNRDAKEALEMYHKRFGAAE
jgi:hypothetical protein